MISFATLDTLADRVGFGRVYRETLWHNTM
jgi:hypothetical protein